jgi:hypothetical protein
MLVAAAAARADQQGGFQLRSLSADPGTPQVLRAGEPVVLEFSGHWRDSCVPALVALEGIGRQRVLRLAPPLQERGCAAVLTPFTHRLEALRFDEDSIGVVKVVVVEADAGWVSAHELVVLSADPNPDPEAASTGAFDVDGAWYDPQRSGSGLLLQHRRSGELETLTGAWFNFSPSGEPRWHLLASARWLTPQRVEGLVYRVSGQPFGCTAQSPNPDCEFGPAEGAEIAAVGLFAISFESADRAVLSFKQPGNPTLNWVPGRPIPLRKLQ